MFLILNRMRGGGVKYGAMIASVAIGLFFGILTLNPYIGLACAIGYNLGERMGWGLWIGNLTDHRDKTSPDDGEGKNNGIQWLARKLVPNYVTNMVNYCRVALTIRGIYWALLTLAPLFFTSINPLVVIGCIVWLGVAFPLACEIGYLLRDKISFGKYGLEFRGGWELQEGAYGLMQDLVLITLGVSYGIS